jgi:hypothetical protein
MVAALRRPALPKSAVILIAAVGLLVADVLAHGQGKTPAALVLAIVVVLVAAHVASRWSWLVSGLVIVDLLIPSDGRYTLAGGLPFQLEPYRVFVALLLVGWIAALLCDRRVKLRRTGFEGPLALILLSIVGSLLLNPSRVTGAESFVIKSLSLEASFLLVIYLVVSVVRTRKILDWLVRMLVWAGTIEGAAAVVERKLNLNIFNHEHLLLPIFHYNNLAIALNTRGGEIRAQGASGTAIELSATMAMLVPFAIYLGVTRGQRRWFGAAAVLLAGDFASGSRTGLISIVVMLIVFLWLRPRQTLRCWPALIPVLAVVHFLDPGAIGGFYNGFFPQGGLVAQQSQTFVGPGGVQENANRLSRLGPELHEFANYNPLFGEGFGTRITGKTSLIASTSKLAGVGDYSFNGQAVPGSGSQDNAEVLDDQWLGTLLETGVLGLIAWAWLFARAIRRLGARARLERDTPDGWLPVATAASLAGFVASMFFYDAFAFTQGDFLTHLLIGFAAVLLALPVAAGTAGGAPAVLPSSSPS